MNALTLLPFTLFSFYDYFLLRDSFLLLMAVIAVIWQLVVVSKALHLSRSAVGEVEAGEKLRDEMAEREEVEAALRTSQ